MSGGMLASCYLTAVSCGVFKLVYSKTGYFKHTKISSQRPDALDLDISGCSATKDS